MRAVAAMADNFISRFCRIQLKIQQKMTFGTDETAYCWVFMLYMTFPLAGDFSGNVFELNKK